MFSKVEPTSTDKVLKGGVPSIVAGGLNVLGNMMSEGAIEVEGVIDGNIQCVVLTVHKSGHVKGDIFAETVFVHGKVEGIIKARNVRLSEHSHFEGVLIYEMLSVEDGAFIDGQCKNMEKVYSGDLEGLESNEDHVAASNEDEEEIRLVADNGLVSF